MKIKLTPFNEIHLLESKSWMNDREISQLFGRVFEPWDDSKQKRWYERMKRDKEQMIFAIHVDDKYVGNIGLKNISNVNRSAEFFILIGNKDYWGRGVGTLATQHFFSFIKDGAKLHKIYLHVNQENIVAIKLYKKVGFVKEGFLKDEWIRDGKFVSVIRMAYFI